MNRSRNQRSSFGFSLGSLGTSFGTGLSSFGLGSSGYSRTGGYRSSNNPYSSSYKSGLLNGRGSGTGSSAYNVLAGSSSNGKTSSNGNDYTSSNPRYNSANTGHTNTARNVTSSSSSRPRYQGARTDSDLVQQPISDRTATQSGNLSASLRSKSSDMLSSVLDRFRDPRSISREASTASREASVIGDRRQSVSEGSNTLYKGERENSLTKDRYRERTSVGRESYTPSRRLGSIGPSGEESNKSSAPLPPPRFRKINFQSSTSNISSPAYDSSSRYNNASTSVYPRSTLTRSQSFHGLNNNSSTPQTTPKSEPRALSKPPRNRTLTNGVSQLDLDRARKTFSSNDLRNNLSSSSCHLERGPEGLVSSPLSRARSISRSRLDLGYSSQPPSRSDSLKVSDRS